MTGLPHYCQHKVHPATMCCVLCGQSQAQILGFYPPPGYVPPQASPPDPPSGYGIDGVEWDGGEVVQIDNGPSIRICCLTCKKQEVRTRHWLEGDGWRDIEIDYNSPASDPSYVGVCRGCPT